MHKLSIKLLTNKAFYLNVNTLNYYIIMIAIIIN